MKILLLLVSIAFCGKMWQSSLENANNFKTAGGVPWYVENGPNFGSLMDTVMSNVYHGVWADKHWINPDSAPRDIDNESTPTYRPYRAYRTIQFHKAQGIGYMSKTLIQFYAWTDIDLYERAGIDDWLSLATISCDSSDNWARTILINLTTDGYIKLVHVPNQGEQTRTFQIDSVNNPSKSRKWKHKRWNRIDMYLDPDSVTGKAIVWQNQFKMSEANVRQCQWGTGMTPFIIQAHFGIYAAAMILKGVVYNDKIRFIEVANDSVAQVLVNEPW